MRYIKEKSVRELAKEHGKRVGKDFLLILDAYIEDRLKAAFHCHNGGHKTIDAGVAGWIGINRSKSR